MNVHIQTGDKEPIEVLVRNIIGAPLLSKLDILLQIRRTSDNFFFDWSDNTFKTEPSVVTRSIPLTQVDMLVSPGEYKLTTGVHIDGFNTSAITNPVVLGDVYQVTVYQSPGTDAGNLPMIGQIRVGGFADFLDASITAIPPFVADAVWDELQSGHQAIGSFGDLMQRVAALQKENYLIDTIVYNTQGLMTSGRIRLFRTKAATDAATPGGTGEGEFATYKFTTTPNIVRPELADVAKSTKE
jgi:hypothetical protein